MKTNFNILLSVVLLVTFFTNSCKKDVLEPVADFTFENKDYYAPVDVQFTNSSVDAITYEWDFGDESDKSTEVNPIHAYMQSGTYTVQLKATGDGSTNTSSKEITIKNEPIPYAAFSYSGGFMIPVDISFSNLSQNTDTYLWDFGDGSTSTEANPVHSYVNPGDYNVRLLATGDYGGSVMDQTLSFSYIGAPTASFIFTGDGGNVPCTVSFTNASTGYINSYLWDFGDGTTSTQENPNHTYNTDGTFEVKLSAIGTYKTDIKTDYIGVEAPIPPDAFFTFFNNQMAPVNIEFTNSSQHATSFYWEFNDGSPSPTSTAFSPSHVFTHGGSYNIKLTANSATGSDVYEQTIVIKEQATTLRISHVDVNSYPPHDPSGNSWDFDDPVCNGHEAEICFRIDTDALGLKYWSDYACDVDPYNSNLIISVPNNTYSCVFHDLNDRIFIQFLDQDKIGYTDSEKVGLCYNFLPSDYLGEYPMVLYFNSVIDDVDFALRLEWYDSFGKEITTKGLSKNVAYNN